MDSSSKPKNMKTKVDCMICAEEVPGRRILKCPFCGFGACKSCIETFLMGIDDDKPRCMENSCKKVWGLDFVANNFDYSFHNKKYRNRRASLLHEREKSLLPGTQGLVIIEKNRIERRDKIANLLDENAMYMELILINKRKIVNIKFDKVKEKEIEKKVFTRACPVEDCRGFLSTALKCGICDIHACKYCHLPKASKKDKEHKCDPDLVATIKLLAVDTKPCPACATPIYKISGCDQMYCTKCHTPFCWIKGTIDRGVIHNPHFYAFQRTQNNGFAPRNRGDINCGGPPTFQTILMFMKRAGVSFEHIESAHRIIHHINQVELANYPNIVGEADNSCLRVSYLMNNITEARWISKLKSQMKKQEKDSEFNMVLSMFVTTMIDIMGNITTCETNKVVVNLLGLNELRVYTNKALRDIGIRYGNIYPCISEGFDFLSNSEKPQSIRRV
jgi:hypothetical protein